MSNEGRSGSSTAQNILVALIGVVFGILLVKGEVANWFRIQEMFRFAAFHMYGIIISAVVVSAVSVTLIRRLGITTISGDQISIAGKAMDWGQVWGGLLFGLGWAATGACPGPLYAQLGAVGLRAAPTLLSAILGAWVYGRFRERLPH